MSNETQSAMRGFYVIGTAMQPPTEPENPGQNLTMLINNKQDVVAAIRHQNPDASEKEVEDTFERLCDVHREMIRQMLSMTANKIDNIRARKNFVNTSSVHQYRTVAEIAEKLGVSKSEARRLKRDGHLDAAFAALSEK